MARRKAAPVKTHRKVTLNLEVDADERLTIQARRSGVSRGELASELLGRSLRHIVVSIRSQTGEAESAA